MASNNNYLGWSMDDIVFETRNKEYGAYELRKITPKHIRIGLIIAVVTFVLFLVASAIDWSFLSKQKEEEEVNTSVTLAEPPSINNTPPPPPPPPPTRPTIKFVEMIVKKQEEVKEEEEPTKIEEIKEQTISTQTQEGDPNAKEVVEEPVVEAPVVDDKPFTFVEQMPEFPGGDAELMKFLRNNIQYPQMERDNDIQGKVLIRFVVSEDGAVTDASIVRGVSPGLDKEAVRVVKMLPKFKPGKQQGKAVKVYYNLPVVFKLQ